MYQIDFGKSTANSLRIFRIIWMNLRMKITGTMKMTGKSRKDIPKKNLQRQSMTKNQK